MLPLSLLVGGGFLVLCDVIARTIVSPAELPIGVVTAFFGAPFFAVVLRTSRSSVTAVALDSVSVELGRHAVSTVSRGRSRPASGCR